MAETQQGTQQGTQQEAKTDTSLDFSETATNPNFYEDYDSQASENSRLTIEGFEIDEIRITDRVVDIMQSLHDKYPERYEKISKRKAKAKMQKDIIKYYAKKMKNERYTPTPRYIKEIIKENWTDL